jgi:hypothetical protein
MNIDIITAIKDKSLFKPYLGRLNSWKHWGICLQAIKGLPIKPKFAPLVKRCTGRDIRLLPKTGFNTILLLVGRRGGKSKISGLLAAHEAIFSGREKSLSAGELGLVSVVSPTRLQSTIIKSYIRAVFNAPMLEAEIVREDRWSFELSNKVTIQILTGSFQLVRGFTLLACVADEICYFGVTDESRVKSDTELIRAIRPGLATTHGPLICVSTKWRRSGWAYNTWSQSFGNDQSDILVWDAPSKLMNPTLDQRIIDQALKEDKAAAMSEYMGQWREDIEAYLPREVVERAVVKNRIVLLPKPNIRYFAFADTSGGRADPALAIGHR